MIGTRQFIAATFISGIFAAGAAQAGISLAPYASVSSTKQLKTNPKNKGTEDEVIKQRNTYGLMATIGMFRILKIQASAGQNQLTTTTKTQKAVDDYEEIDYKTDLNMNTDDPEKETKVTETQRIGRVGIVLDPGFWIFILRAKGGVQATQRIVTLEQSGSDPTTKTTPITYKPFAGGGAGVRFGPRMFFMAEYNIFMYQFPKTAPFEREVAVSYNVSI